MDGQASARLPFAPPQPAEELLIVLLRRGRPANFFARVYPPFTPGQRFCEACRPRLEECWLVDYGHVQQQID